MGQESTSGASRASKYLRWTVNIDTARQPLTELVHVLCPVCGEGVSQQLYLNTVTPPGGATLEEALTTHADYVAQQAIANHLLQGSCSHHAYGEHCAVGKVYQDGKAEHEYWIVRTVTSDQSADGMGHFVVEHCTGAEVSTALKVSGETVRQLERQLQKAKVAHEELHTLIKAIDKIDLPF